MAVFTALETYFFNESIMAGRYFMAAFWESKKKEWETAPGYYKAAFAFEASSLKAFASFIAKSAKIFLSSSIFAFLSPAIKRE